MILNIFRYTLQLEAISHHWDYKSSSSKSMEITTFSAKPNIPKIKSISTSTSGGVFITFDYPCPYTGLTEFRTKVECEVKNDCDDLHDLDFVSLKEGEIKVMIE